MKKMDGSATSRIREWNVPIINTQIYHLEAIECTPGRHLWKSWDSIWFTYLLIGAAPYLGWVASVVS